MSDQSPDSPATHPAPARRSGRTKYAVIIALALGLVGAGAYATNSFSKGPGFGPPFFGHGWGGPGSWKGGFDPARAEQRADRMIRHLAVEVDATTEQQEKLRSIVKSAVKDVLPMRQKFVNARKQARNLLTSPTIDRTAIEKLRSEQIGTADAISKRLVQAVTDAAEVLTPEQRNKLADFMPPWRRGWGWRRG